MANESMLRFHNPPTLPATVGYSQVAEARGGRTIYVAGQVALDTSGLIVGPGDPQAQVRQVFVNLQAALVDIGHLPAIRAVRDQYVDTARPRRVPPSRPAASSAMMCRWRLRRSRWSPTDHASEHRIAICAWEG